MNTRFSIGIGALLVLLSTGLAAETLVYEREYTLIGEADNTLRIEISADDRVVVERPLFMTRSGRHSFRAPSGTFERLRSGLKSAGADTDALHRDIQRRAAATMQVVTDPEFSRFALVDAQREPVESVTVGSLEAWSQRIQDPRLARLHALEQDFFGLMDEYVREDAQ